MSTHQDDSLIIRTWHEITVNALHSRATDIHIEAGPQETLERIRVLGNLFRLATLTHGAEPWTCAILRITASPEVGHWVRHSKKAGLTGGFCDAETLQLLRICAESGSRREMLNKATDTLGAQLSNQLNTLS